MRKVKGILVSLSLVMILIFSCMAVSAEESETSSEVALEADISLETDMSAEGDLSQSDRQALENFADQSIQTIVGMSEAEMEEYIHPSSILSIPSTSAVSSVQSWMEVKEELGDFVSVEDHEITVEDDAITVVSNCIFANGTGSVTTTISRDDLSMEGMVFSTGEQTLGEKLKEAALNTLMGVGVVFLMLLFLCVVFAQIKHVNKLETLFQKKETSVETPAEASVPVATVASPVTAGTSASAADPMNDGTLVAVIAAAIAAAEGTSVDGFVVRSIKKHRNYSKSTRSTC